MYFAMNQYPPHHNHAYAQAPGPFFGSSTSPPPPLLLPQQQQQQQHFNYEPQPQQQTQYQMPLQLPLPAGMAQQHQQQQQPSSSGSSFMFFSDGALDLHQQQQHHDSSNWRRQTASLPVSTLPTNHRRSIEFPPLPSPKIIQTAGRRAGEWSEIASAARAALTSSSDKTEGIDFPPPPQLASSNRGLDFPPPPQFRAPGERMPHASHHSLPNFRSLQQHAYSHQHQHQPQLHQSQQHIAQQQQPQQRTFVQTSPPTNQRTESRKSPPRVAAPAPPPQRKPKGKPNTFTFRPVVFPTPNSKASNNYNAPLSTSSANSVLSVKRKHASPTELTPRHHRSSPNLARYNSGNADETAASGDQDTSGEAEPPTKKQRTGNNSEPNLQTWCTNLLRERSSLGIGNGLTYCRNAPSSPSSTSSLVIPLLAEAANEPTVQSAETISLSSSRSFNSLFTVSLSSVQPGDSSSLDQEDRGSQEWRKDIASWEQEMRSKGILYVGSPGSRALLEEEARRSASSASTSSSSSSSTTTSTPNSKSPSPPLRTLMPPKH